MKLQKGIRLSSWVRLVVLSLLLGFGLVTGTMLASRTAHAATAITVSTCDASHLVAAITQANSDNAGDVITFSCSGDITLTSTLQITGSMTLDGNGKNVTLDGGNSVQVLSVNSGVNFTLNALTIAHGSSGYIGGGLYNNGTVSISNSTFSSNSAAGGGGLENDSGTMNITNSTIANNFATCSAGGLENDSGTMNISNSTIANNSTGCGGGGIVNTFHENSTIPGTMNITNSTVDNNSAYDGGGLYNEGPLSISNSTIANNTVTTDGGGFYNLDSTVSIGGSIVAANTGGDCFNFGGTATLTDRGYNLESSTDCGFTGTGSLQNTDPKLASALASNGGPTQTLALLDGSPAINKIPTSACAVTTDQRSISRPQGQACDIGAFEYRVPTLSLPATITVNATGPNGAPVTYTVTASEPDDASATPTVSCSPASGNTFPIGTTTVTCTANDTASPPDTTKGSFQVVVVADNDLALSNMPANITTNATSPQGALVTYTLPTVVDEDSPLPTASCTPASGATFATGTTLVTCTVSDSDDSHSPVSGSFQVVVKGASAQVSDLISLVNSFHLSGSLQNSLDVKLNAALKAINAGQTATACSDLSDFIGEAQSQSGKELTTSQANQLIAAAKQVQAVLSC